MTPYGIHHFAQRDPNAPAVIEPEGRCWTRATLVTTVNQLCHALRQHGFAQGEVIAILAPNCIEFIAVYLAATHIGLYVVPINWHLSAAEIGYVLENSGAKGLFAHERVAPVLNRLWQESSPSNQSLRVSFGSIPGFLSFEEWLADRPRENVAEPRRGRMLIYTSATTGRPKAIDLPLADADEAFARTVAFHISCGNHPEDGNVHLCASTLYHAAPLDFTTTSLHLGHLVVLPERWEPEAFLGLVQHYRVTTTFMVPAMFVRLMKLSSQVRGRYDVSSLRLVSHSAAPCPPQVKRELIEWWGPIVWESYGAAEGVGTAVTSSEWLEHPGTVGRPMRGTTLRILDDDGRELPPGEIGAIYLTRFTGDRFAYKNDPEKTQAAYRGELFTVGDVGYLDEAGYLYLCDRKVDMIISGGVNIYSAEIEQVLVQHPQVLDCAVFGVPDEILGESVRAVVQLAPGTPASAALTAELVMFLRERLSAVKLPRKIEYASELPRDPNGKLFKRSLRAKFWEGRERKI